MLIHELFNSNTYIVLEKALIIVLDSKYAVCMANNGEDTKHTRHISRRVHTARNGEKYKFHKIDWCEGGLQLVYIATTDVGDNDLNPIINYIMISLDN